MKRFALSAIAGMLLCCALPVRGQDAVLPDGPGKELVQASCTQCHGLALRRSFAVEASLFERTAARTCSVTDM